MYILKIVILMSYDHSIKNTILTTLNEESCDKFTESKILGIVFKFVVS